MKKQRTQKSGRNLNPGSKPAVTMQLTEEKKTTGSRLFKQFEGALNSAGPKDASPDQNYLRISVNKKANGSANIKDAPSRFSSCTAKTSPSTDNNSVGGTPNENGARDGGGWELALQAKIDKCANNVRDKSDDPLTPTRIRACSDTTPSNSMTKGGGDCSTPPSNSNSRKHPNLMEVNVTRGSQKATVIGRSKFIEPGQMMAGPVKTVKYAKA